MAITVLKWGNSLGIKIPKKLSEEIGIQEGDRVNMSTSNGQIIIVKTTRPTLAELCAQITDEQREGNRELFHGPPMGSEIW